MGDRQGADGGDCEDLDERAKPAEVRFDPAHAMPVAGELGRHRLHRRCDFGVDRRRRVDSPADPQAGRVVPGCRQEGLQDLGPVGVARQVAAHRIETERRISDRSRDHAAGGEARPILTKDRAAGDPSARWLQAHHAAARGRNADRPTTVATVAQRAEAGGNRGRGAATRAARGPGLVDGISGGREHRTLGNRSGPELRRIRLSQNGGALVLQSSDGEAVDLCNRFLEVKRPEAVAITGERCRFLDGNRNPIEKAQWLAARDPLFGSRRLTLSQFPSQQDVGVEFGIDTGDALVVKRNQITWLDAPFLDRACLLQRGFECPGVIDHPLTVSTLLPLPGREDGREIAVAQAVEVGRVRRHLDDVGLAAVVDEEKLARVLRSVELDA